MNNSLESVLIGSFINSVVGELSKPEGLAKMLKLLADSCSHSAEDVAIDALDALKAGHLTKDQALRIIQVCLESHPTKTASVTLPELPREPFFDATLNAIFNGRF